jgi:hypothetical protein
MQGLHAKIKIFPFCPGVTIKPDLCGGIKLNGTYSVD